MTGKDTATGMKTYNVLIVDDEKEILIALHTTLKRARQFSSEISVASNGAEAISELEKKQFDIVLSDYMMPGMNGLELLTKVKEKCPDAVRVLVTASSDLNVTKDAINRVAVDHFIEKPWDNRELTSMVYQALRRKNLPKKGRKPKRSGDDEPSDADVPVSLLPMMSERNGK
jgi:DNA-binding NtrC family response regulator